jgi:hypothetical protein
MNEKWCEGMLKFFWEIRVVGADQLSLQSLSFGSFFCVVRLSRSPIFCRSYEILLQNMSVVISFDPSLGRKFI